MVKGRKTNSKSSSDQLGVASIDLNQFVENTGLKSIQASAVKSKKPVGLVNLKIDVFRERFQQTGEDSESEFTVSKKKKDKWNVKALQEKAKFDRKIPRPKTNEDDSSGQLLCYVLFGILDKSLEAGAKEPKIVTMDVDGKKSKTKKHKLNGNRLEWYQRFEYDCRKESKITFKLKDAKGVVGETTMPVSAFNWAQMT